MKLTSLLSYMPTAKLIELLRGIQDGKYVSHVMRLGMTGGFIGECDGMHLVVNGV
jgi:hypothetical protein